MTAAERRKTKLRQHITDQATALYHANGGVDGGFEKTTIEDIAEKSDICLRTFFRYFSSKTDVIYLDIKSAREHLTTFINERPTEEPHILAAINGRFDQVRFFMDNKGNKERLLRSLNAPKFEDKMTVLRNELKQSIAEFLTEPSERGEPLRFSEARLAASIIVDIIGDVLDDWGKDTSIDVEKRSRMIINLLPGISEQLTNTGS